MITSTSLGAPYHNVAIRCPQNPTATMKAPIVSLETGVLSVNAGEALGCEVGRLLCSRPPQAYRSWALAIPLGFRV